MNLCKDEINRIIEETVIKTAALLGIGDTELSYTKASAKFGEFFRAMVRAKRIRPCRVGKGKNGTHWYSVQDIVALRHEEERKAQLKM